MNVTLFRIKGLCTCNAVKDLKMRSSMFIQVGLKSNGKYPYKKEKKTQIEVQTRVSEEKSM